MMPLWDYIVIDFYDFPLTLGVSIVTLGMGMGRVPPLKGLHAAVLG
jgi:hypothetical protein